MALSAWQVFVETHMAAEMKKTGSLGAAMKTIAAKWKAEKSNSHTTKAGKKHEGH